VPDPELAVEDENRVRQEVDRVHVEDWMPV